MLRFGFGLFMPSALLSNLKGRGRLHRGTAFLFLVLIFADLTLPQRCCGELRFPSDAGGAVSAISPASDSISVATHDSQPAQPPESVPDEKGCFCCCAQILQSNVFFVSVAALKIPPTDPDIPSFVSLPPRDMFHPPRSA